MEQAQAPEARFSCDRILQGNDLGWMLAMEAETGSKSGWTWLKSSVCSGGLEETCVEGGLEDAFK